MNLVDVLGVPQEASPEQVRTAYRALVQLLHPDRLRHVRPEVRAFAEERLKTLNQAYETLGDPGKRAAHDRQASLDQPAPSASRNGGLAGWAAWRLAFAGRASVPSAVSLAAVFLATHLVFTWLAMGDHTAIAREKRRLFDQANDLILRAQRAVIETG